MAIYFFFFFLLSSAKAEFWVNYPWWEICGDTNFTSNSTYASNLDTLLTTLTANATASGYAATTVGRAPNQIFGLALCRGDLSPSDCQTCMNSANHDAQQQCPFNKAAVIWYDYCVQLYSQLTLSPTDNTDQQILINVNNATDHVRFNQLLGELMDRIADWAAYNSTKRFATGEIGYYRKETPAIYGLVQCTPDMGSGECRSCLKELLDQIPTTDLYWKIGGRVLGVRCTMRFESDVFYKGEPTVKLTSVVSPAPSPDAPAKNSSSSSSSAPEGSVVGSSGKKSRVKVVLAIALPIAASALLFTAILICFCCKRNLMAKLHHPNEEGISSVDSFLYTSSSIKKATSNFADVNKLGQGGFGVVYKGVLADGQIVAVKKLLSSSNEGLAELKNELLLVAKLQHRNLVKLLGVCLQEEKYLIYEYISNGSLNTHLFDPIRRLKLQWTTRYNIICGIAKGLQYLHEESQLKIVHRDLKPANILLDAEMNAKIADFGIAKLFSDDQTQGNTNRVVGTFGYMAPEYVMQGHYSTKSDVYSFGVLVLEIVSGMKCSGSSDESSSEQPQDLLSNTWEKWSNGSIYEIVDESLGNHVPRSEVLRCIHIGLLCVQENPFDRPNMSSINVMLSSSTISLQAPSKPPFIFTTQATNGFTRSEERGTLRNDLTVSELEPR